MPLPAKKKLLVLDVNGFLLDTYFNSEKQPDHPADGKVNSHFVYRRPYCNEFLEFCFENFEVGIWSSAQRHNVDKFVDFIFGDLKSKLLFSWHQTECTDTGLKAPDNRFKPVFLKELSKLWNKVKPDLPWKKGDYGPFNTLLIDDSPYKALRNPPHTAVFPYPYKVSNGPDDSLGGAMLNYLEGLATASNVQHYVRHHPFGQPPISEESPNWYLYRKILLPTENQDATWASSCQEYELQSISLEDREVGLQSGNGQHSESSPHIARRKRKHGLNLATSTNQYSVPCMEKEENFVDEAAMPNMEKSISLEDREVGSQSDKGQHLELGSRIGKQKKNRVHLTTGTNQYSVPRMEKEENGVVEAAMAIMEEGKGISQASLSQEHKSYNLFRGDKDADLLSDHGEPPEFGLAQKAKRKKNRVHLTTGTQYSVPHMEKEENGGAEAAMANMEKSKGMTRASLRQEHESYNLFRGDTDADLLSYHGEPPEFGLAQKTKRKKKKRVHLTTGGNQYSVPCMETEECGVVEAAMANMEKSKGMTQASLSQEHESYNFFRGDKAVDLLSYHGEPPEFGLAQKTKHKFHQATSISRESALDMGHKDNGLAMTVETCKARANGTPMASFSQEHKAHNMLSKDKEVAARTDEDRCGNNSSTKSGRKFCDRNNFRHFNKGHHYKSSHFSKDYSNRRSSSHFQMNRYGGSRASCFPGRQFQEKQVHQNGVNASLQTQVAQGGLYASNNMYGSNAVHANLPLYQQGGYINDGQVLWPTLQGHRWDGFQYVSHGQSYNPSHIGSTVLQGQSYNPSHIGSAVLQGQSYNPNQGATELQGPGHRWNRIGSKVIQSPLPNFVSHEQMHGPFYSTQYQGHGKQFQHRKSGSSSRHFGRR